LRQSPWSGLALNDAGIFPEEMFMAGPDIVKVRWESPGTYRFIDVFGDRQSAGSLFVLDEAALLLGILSFAAGGNIAAAEFINRAWFRSTGQQRNTERKVASPIPTPLFERVRDAIVSRKMFVPEHNGNSGASRSAGRSARSHRPASGV
jgi:hypothetical protein